MLQLPRNVDINCPVTMTLGHDPRICDVAPSSLRETLPVLKQDKQKRCSTTTVTNKCHCNDTDLNAIVVVFNIIKCILNNGIIQTVNKKKTEQATDTSSD